MPRPRIMLRRHRRRGGAEVRPVRVHHGIHQLARVRRVGVRMMPAEVLERLAVDDRARGRAERPLQNRPRIGPVTAGMAS